MRGSRRAPAAHPPRERPRQPRLSAHLWTAAKVSTRERPTMSTPPARTTRTARDDFSSPSERAIPSLYRPPVALGRPPILDARTEPPPRLSRQGQRPWLRSDDAECGAEALVGRLRSFVEREQRAVVRGRLQRDEGVI